MAWAATNDDEAAHDVAATHDGAAAHDVAATNDGAAAYNGISSYERWQGCPWMKEGLRLSDELDDAFISELVDEPGDAQWRGLQEGRDLFGRVGSWW